MQKELLVGFAMLPTSLYKDLNLEEKVYYKEVYRLLKSSMSLIIKVSLISKDKYTIKAEEELQHLREYFWSEVFRGDKREIMCQTAWTIIRESYKRSMTELGQRIGNSLPEKSPWTLDFLMAWDSSLDSISQKLVSQNNEDHH